VLFKHHLLIPLLHLYFISIRHLQNIRQMLPHPRPRTSSRQLLKLHLSPLRRFRLHDPAQVNKLLLQNLRASFDMLRPKIHRFIVLTDLGYLDVWRRRLHTYPVGKRLVLFLHF